MTASTSAGTAGALPYDMGAVLLARYAGGMAAAARIEADLAAAIAPVKAAFDAKLAPVAAELAELRGEAERWFASHGAELTGPKRKSAELAGCVIGTRVGRAKLVFAGDDEAAIAALREGGFARMLRRVFQLDRAKLTEAVDGEPEGAIAKLGFRVERPETFVLEPATRTGRKG